MTRAWTRSPSHSLRACQFGVFLTTLGMEPLLELVEHEHDLPMVPVDALLNSDQGIAEIDVATEMG